MNSNHSEIVENKSQLFKYFTNACKPRSDWKVGCEYEKFLIGYPDFKPITYEGEQGIGKLLQELERKFYWKPEYEGENIIALLQDKASITLEPGGQVELSGKTFTCLHNTFKEVNQHLAELRDVTRHWQTKWFACGMNPFIANEDIPWMPKNRYKIMRSYLIKQGHLSHKMMKQTATIQVNIDYHSEADAIKKMRIATGINTIVAGIYANSPIYNGKPNGFMSERQYIWQYTDPARCGIIQKLFSEDYCFSDYIDYVLNNKMFLIKRDGQMIDMTHITFKEYMEKGDQGNRATFDDWAYHLSTVFPEVRLLRYLELRGTDSQTEDLYMTIPALWKGILYDEQALDASWELVRDLDYETRVQWHHNMCRQGLQTPIKNYKTADLARELYQIAWDGLKRQNCLNYKKQDETIYLEPLYEKVIKPGKSPAESLLEKWDGNLDKLLKHYII